MAVIGRAAAVVEARRLKLSGFVAWLGWAFVHLLKLMGDREPPQGLRDVGVALRHVELRRPHHHRRPLGDDRAARSSRFPRQDRVKVGGETRSPDGPGPVQSEELRGQARTKPAITPPWRSLVHGLWLPRTGPGASGGLLVNEARCRGAPRLRRGAPSAGGLGGARSPPCNQLFSSFLAASAPLLSVMRSVTDAIRLAGMVVSLPNRNPRRTTMRVMRPEASSISTASTSPTR